MKKQSERMDGADRQLGFDLVFSTVRPAVSSTSFERPILESHVQNSVVDLTPLLQRRASENDRVLLRAVQTRAAHLTDCLRKQP